MIGYICGGELDSVICDAPEVEAMDYSRNVYFCPEQHSDDLTLRKAVPIFPEWARHVLKPPPRRKYFIAPDAIGGMQSWMGGDLFVSESAMRLLEPHVRSDCVFVKALVDNAPTPYYLLWITKLVDALDEAKSTLKSIPYLCKSGHKSNRVYEYVFKSEEISDLYLFRLPGLRYAGDSLKNCSTQRFVDLVSELGLDGFVFRTGVTATSTVIRPVPLRKR